MSDALSDYYLASIGELSEYQNDAPEYKIYSGIKELESEITRLKAEIICVQCRDKIGFLRKVCEPCHINLQNENRKLKADKQELIGIAEKYRTRAYGYGYTKKKELQELDEQFNQLKGEE